MAQFGFCGSNIVSFFCSVDTSKVDTLYLMECVKGVLFQDQSSNVSVIVGDTLFGKTHIVFLKSLTAEEKKQRLAAGLKLVDAGSSIVTQLTPSEEGNWHKFFLYSSKVYGMDSNGSIHFPAIPLDAYEDIHLLRSPMFRVLMFERIKNRAIRGMAEQMN